MISIRPIDLNSKKQKDEFIGFAWKIYRDYPHWVPPLWMDMRMKLNVKKHPFYQLAEIQCWMAYDEKGEAVGRIAAVENRHYNEHHGSKVGFFGFFECVDDVEVARVLLAQAEQWLKARGLTESIGPASPSSNYDFGLLTEGFDDEPRLMMTYNPPYYANLIRESGYDLAMNLLAYKVKVPSRLDENPRLQRISKMALERANVSVRYINLKKLKDELPWVKKMYNTAWEKNWGFVPLTEKEIDTIAGELKLGADPEFIPVLMDSKGDVIGFALALPDFNYLFKSMNGRLFPFNFLRLLTQRKKIKWLRIYLLGILPEYRNKGLDAVLYYELTKSAVRKGYHYAEASWILENNVMMNRGMEVTNGQVYKRYALFEKKW